MAGLELFFFYLLSAAAPLSLAAINAAQGGMSLFFLWRLVHLRWRPTTAEWLLIAYLAANVLAALFSPLRYQALVGVLNHWSWSALFLGASLPWAVRKNLRTWTTFLVVTALLTVPMDAAEFFLGTDFHIHALARKVPIGTVNAYGYFSQHLTYAGVISALMFFFAARALYGEEKRRWPFWVGAVSCGLGLFMSLARTYWVAAVPAALVLLWKKGRTCALAGVLGLCVLGGGLYLFGPASFHRRVAGMWNMNNPSVAERLYLWVSGFQMWRDRPLLGWGPGIYEETAGPYKAPYAHLIHYPTHVGFQTVSHAHNIYLMIAIQSGLLGLVLFLAFVVAAFRGIARQPDPALRYGVLAAFTAFLVGGFFEFNAGDAEVATLMFFLVGLALNRNEEADDP